MPYNRLMTSESLYLRQHADNPVDWYFWCEEALIAARDQDKPILLSIGYSACHWCHVMAHESFENAETAILMNQLFINIKVDRETRPDLDKVYQTSFQMLMQRSGGWPLTLFLNPHTLLPFFAGTYFPPVPYHGLPSFKDVLLRVADYYKQHREEINTQNQAFLKVMNSLTDTDVLPANIQFDEYLLAAAAKTLINDFDPEYGGFGHAPKFPQPSLLYFLLDYYHLKRDVGQDEPEINLALHFTLKKMADGGLFDQVGGGFFRYSVDERWEIPHFEKMLYDNGQLLGLYAITRDIESTQMTAQWVLHEMQSPAGAYYASIDADSEGKEGHYYCWQREEIKNILSPHEFAIVAAHLNLNHPANFEHSWHLVTQSPLADSEKEIYYQARLKLFNERQHRISPARNENCIIAWNGLMIKGMALAAQYMHETSFTQSAQRAADDIYQRYWDSTKKRFYYAFLDDYAFMLDGLLQLLQLEWRTQDLHFAIQLADALLNHFADLDKGGFFFTSHDHEPLIYRPKPFADEALPSGNGIAAKALLQLGYLLGEIQYLTAAQQTLQIAWNDIQQYPHYHTTLLQACYCYQHPSKIIILRGDKKIIKRWQDKLQANYHPEQLVFAISAEVDNLPLALAHKVVKDKACAYICRGLECKLAAIDEAEIINRTI